MEFFCRELALEIKIFADRFLNLARFEYPCFRELVLPERADLLVSAPVTER